MICIYSIIQNTNLICSIFCFFTESSKKRSKRSRSRSQSSEDSESRSRSRSRSRHGRRRSHSPNRRSRHSHGRSPRRLYRKTDSYGKGDREPPQEKRILGVFGLSISTTERQLRDVFETYERLEAVRMVYDAQTGKSRGFAFLYFDKIEAAKEAKEKLDGTRLDGNLIRVDYSVTDKPHEPTPGIYMGKTNRRTFLRRSPRGFGFRGNGYDRYPHSFRESFGSQYYDRRRWSRSRSPRKHSSFLL